MTSFKKAISNLFWSPFSSKEKVEKYQKTIRDKEWKVLKKHIPENCSFLDVGCGAGDNLLRAKKDLNCKVQGIDPCPGEHGVGRYLKQELNEIIIKKGYSENLPYKDEEFDVVFCSHVLEHVNDEQKSLQEMKRVLKQNGTLIIGMPTAIMSVISYLSIILFTTHINILFCLKSIGKKDFFHRLRVLFVPTSHSYPRAKTIFYDLYMYRVKRWKKIVCSEFKCTKVLQPYLYPYPDYFQWFKIHKSNLGSSSVFFICSKKP